MSVTDRPYCTAATAAHAAAAAAIALRGCALGRPSPVAGLKVQGMSSSMLMRSPSVAVLHCDRSCFHDFRLAEYDPSAVSRIIALPSQHDLSVWLYESLRQVLLELASFVHELSAVCDVNTCPKMCATENWAFLCAAHPPDAPGKKMTPKEVSSGSSSARHWTHTGR